MGVWLFDNYGSAIFIAALVLLALFVGLWNARSVQLRMDGGKFDWRRTCFLCLAIQSAYAQRQRKRFKWARELYPNARENWELAVQDVVASESAKRGAKPAVAPAVV